MIPKRTAQRAAITQVHVPAPVGGINTSMPAGAIPPSDAVHADNVIANEFGLRSRLGYQEWCTGMSSLVRTVIPFASKSNATDKLFAATATALYDCSSSSAAPTVVHTFGTSGTTSGYGVATTMVTLAGHFQFYADEANGLLRYDESTATWAAAADITGIDVADVRFVMVWKNRLWMVLKDSGTAAYLPVGTISGAATSFYFGNKFRAGGYLVGLWNWTADGGTGIDDYLVAVSSGGDVLVYQGTDPDTAIDFSMRGDWFVGALPAGRRIATDFGGELLLLTSVGILPMSKLLSGQAVNPSVYSSRKIQGQFARLMAERGTLRGWEIRTSPQDQALIVTVPDAQGVYTQQLALSLSTGAWSTLTGYPMHCAEAWNGDLFFGGPGGIVYKATGSQDAVSRAGTGGTDITLTGLTSFQSFGTGSRKQVTLIRPHFRAEGKAPSYSVAARYDFNTAQVADTVIAAASAPDTWDTGVWDTALWSTGDAQTYSDVRGATGIGTSVAIAYKAEIDVTTTLIGFDVTVRAAGIL